MISKTAGLQRERPASWKTSIYDSSAVRRHFTRRYSAAKRQAPIFSTRDRDALRFLLEQDCSTRGQALSTVDAVFRERIKGTSLFSCLVGLYAWRTDRQCRGPREASKAEIRKYAILFAEASNARRSA